MECDLVSDFLCPSIVVHQKLSSSVICIAGVRRAIQPVRPGGSVGLPVQPASLVPQRTKDESSKFGRPPSRAAFLKGP